MSSVGVKQRDMEISPQMANLSPAAENRNEIYSNIFADRCRENAKPTDMASGCLGGVKIASEYWHERERLSPCYQLSFPSFLCHLINACSPLHIL